MTLAAPVGLAAAAAIIVPILIHLFGRPRPRPRRFPSLMLLRRAQSERHSTARLRRVVSLILRCLALVLLAVVLAGPITAWPPLAGLGERAGATAIVLDTSPSMSASMSGPRPIDRARDAARLIVEALPQGEEIVLVVGGGAPMTAVASEAERVLASTEVVDRRARLGEDLAALLHREPRPARIVLLSDLQSTSLTAVRAARSASTSVIAVDVGAELDGNSALTDLSARDRVHLRGRPIELELTARTWGASPGRVPVVVEGDADEVTVGLDLLPDASAPVAVEVHPEHAGSQSWTARLPSDALRSDDRRIFATLVRERLRVAVLGEPSRTRFITAALAPYPAGDPRLTVEIVGGDAVDGDVDAAIVTGPGLREQTIEDLQARAEAGAGVLVFATADRRALDALGFAAVAIGDPVAREDEASLAELAIERPPLWGFTMPGAGDLTVARFGTIPRLQIAEKAALTTLARYDDGTPALLERAMGRGRAILFATAPDDAWSDLVRMPEFVPLMHRLALHLAAGTEPTILGGAPGEPTVGLLPPGTEELRVVSAQGDEMPLDVTDSWWRCTPGTVGSFRLQASGEDIAAFAVNLDAAESDPTRLSAREVLERLRPLEASVVEADALPALLGRMGAGLADVSSLVALLALLVLAIESVQSLQPRGNAADER
ncbi:MAG: BatA domain-containing protein [Armatimonadota bacterium]|jgi:hypothetical protein